MSSSTATHELGTPATSLARSILFGHPLANLLELSAGEILESYRKSQTEEFRSVLRQVKSSEGDLTSEIPLLREYLSHRRVDGLGKRLNAHVLEELFLHVHEHVMGHPVWEHPFFVRVAAGDLDVAQLRRFARQYFNQVKNTRQCVALALGRFHTMIPQPDGVLNVVLSELTQMVLSGLLADEYGSAAGHAHHTERAMKGTPAVHIRELFSHTTHPELFRRFQKALGDSARDFDVPMLHGVADNVLVQRILSSHRAYDHLEALASVGLGMEWGVPAFFSMIMAGIIKVADRERLPLDARSMEIWSAHVSQDVEHAIAVMLATSFYVTGTREVARIENATNVLMAFRYNMMSDIYRDVFAAPCADIGSIALSQRYYLRDDRIEPALATERSGIPAACVRDYDWYVTRRVALPIAGSDEGAGKYAS